MRFWQLFKQVIFPVRSEDGIIVNNKKYLIQENISMYQEFIHKDVER